MDFPLHKSPVRRLLTIFVCLLFLTACTSSGMPDRPRKVGLHIDAELEFAIAYPLDWRKERRVSWRKTTGSVVWFLPGSPATGTFEVTSMPTGATDQPLDTAFAEVRARHPGLIGSTEEQVELPAGQALHLTGSTRQATVSAHLLRGATRDYLLNFTATPQNFDIFSSTADEMLDSFRILGVEP